LEEVAVSSVAAVEALRVDAVELAHAARQRCCECLQRVGGLPISSSRAAASGGARRRA
jgi:hypothetical protein